MTGSALPLGSASATTLPDRFLPATSCSTLALSFLLIRCAHLAVCRGGLRTDASRLIAGSLLEGFIQSLSGSLKEGARFRMQWSATWRCSCPRPPTVPDDGYFFIEVGEDGIASSPDWLEAMDSGAPRRHASRVWSSALGGPFDDPSGRISLLQLLVLSCRAPTAQGLFAQLQWHTSLTFEEYWLDSTGVHGSKASSLRITLQDEDSMWGTPQHRPQLVEVCRGVAGVLPGRQGLVLDNGVFGPLRRGDNRMFTGGHGARGSVGGGGVGGGGSRGGAVFADRIVWISRQKFPPWCIDCGLCLVYSFRFSLVEGAPEG